MTKHWKKPLKIARKTQFSVECRDPSLEPCGTPEMIFPEQIKTLPISAKKLQNRLRDFLYYAQEY